MDAQLWSKVDTLKLGYGDKLDYVLDSWGLSRGVKKELAAQLNVEPRSFSRFLADDGEFPPARRREVEGLLGLQAGWLDRDWTDLNALNRALDERRATATILAADAFKPHVYGASIDHGSIPKPISDSQGVAMHVGSVVTRAVQRMIDKNEMWYEGKSRDELIEVLHELAAELTRRKIDTEDLDMAIAYLRRRGKQQGKG